MIRVNLITKVKNRIFKNLPNIRVEKMKSILIYNQITMNNDDQLISDLTDTVKGLRINIPDELKINKELVKLKKVINERNQEIIKLKKIIDEKTQEIILLKKPKGYACSRNGSIYENNIHNIVSKCSINGIPFNTQKENELAGSSSKNDIECNFNNNKDIGIEIKKSGTPDWMQCSIKYNTDTSSWETNNNSLNLYDGFIPPFMENPITHEEWSEIKRRTNRWNDVYLDIPSDTISRLYREKGCSYIQISNGYGLYHLGNDVCKFGVPLFNIEQRLRIRAKIHTKKK